MALAAWALGAALLLVAARPRGRWPARSARAGDRVGPRRWYGVALRALNVFSDRLHDAEVRDLRNSIAAVLVPTGVLVALGFAFTPTRGVVRRRRRSRPGTCRSSSCSCSAWPRRSPSSATAGGCAPCWRSRCSGFALAAVYAVVGAPDVALVAVLVETIFTLVFVGVFSRLPPSRRRDPRAARPRRRNVRRRGRRGRRVVRRDLGDAVADEPGDRRRGRADRADARRARRRRRHRDPRRLPRARHDGRDHRPGGRVVGVASLLRRGRSW